MLLLFFSYTNSEKLRLQSEFIYCRNKYEALVKKNNLYKRNNKKNKKISGPGKTR